MIKVRFGKRKRDEMLRPLSEKEIQEKLYGAFHVEEDSRDEGNSRGFQALLEERPVKVAERPSGAIIAPPKREKASFRSFWSKLSPILSKIFKFVWNVLKAFLTALWNFGKVLFKKLTTRWGASILAVTLLFVAIQSLNAYRAGAMKAAPKTSFGIAAPRKTVSTPALSSGTSSSKQTSLNSQETVLRPVSESTGPEVGSAVGRNEPPTIPSFLKPYVIQICSYAREEDADRLTRQMTDSRWPAFYQQVDRASGKAFYLVFLGRFETFREAQSKLDEFRKDPIAKDFADSFVRSL